MLDYHLYGCDVRSLLMVTFPFIRFRRDIVKTGTQVSKYKLSLSNELNNKAK